MTPPPSAAELSLELNVPQTALREFLRDDGATLPPGTTKWIMDDNQAEKARLRFGSGSIDPRRWTLEKGDVVLRSQLIEAYSARRQSGIIAPTTLPGHVIAISDPKDGSRYGYDEFEGLRPDGTFWYTGQGQVGDQQFKDGNLRLLRAAKNGDIVHLFHKAGQYITYSGEFALGEHGYRFETIRDREGNPRRGIIFEFVPVDADLSILAPEGAPTHESAEILRWYPPEFDDFVVELPVPVDPSARIVTRVEFQLQADFGTWLESRNTPPKMLRLHIGPVTIEPDLYVEANQWLVEAKRSTSREHVRMAIGQVLDYTNIARRQNVAAQPMVLLPSRPTEDLVELLRHLDIYLAYRLGDGFVIE